MPSKEARGFRQALTDAKAEQKLLERSIKEKEAQVAGLKQHGEDLAMARMVIAETARLTQQNVKGYIESLVTMALRSVFDESYRFLCDFEIKRNKSECLLRVQEGEWEPFVPEEDQGGGMAAILSFTLQVVIWSLQKPRTRPVFYLEEPMTAIGSGDSEDMKRAVDMMQEVSKRLDFQLIINTHEGEIARIADRVFTVTKVKGRSQVAEVAQSVERGLTKAGQGAGRSLVVKRPGASDSGERLKLSPSAGSSPALRSRRKKLSPVKRS